MTVLCIEWKESHPIYTRISNSTKIFLSEHDPDILVWFWDSLQLTEQFKSATHMSDYSFIIAPAYKALEKWLLLIAPYMGVPPEITSKARQGGKLGLFLNEKDCMNFLDNALASLEKVVIDTPTLRSSVQSLNSTLKNFRHNPAHCGTKIENPLKAEMDFMIMLRVVDDITQLFIESGLIPNRGLKVLTDEEIKLRETAKLLHRLGAI